MTHPRRGGVVIIVALCIMFLTGFVALVFDLGYARVIQSQLRVAADASASAAVYELDGTDDGLDNARAVASAVAALHEAAGQAVSLETADLECGSWDNASRAFTVETDAELVDAMRVTTRGESPLVFGGVLGAMSGSSPGDTIPTSSSSVVIRAQEPAGAVDCYYPLAIPQCLIEEDGLSALQGYDFNSMRNASVYGMQQGAFAFAGSAATDTWTRPRIQDCEYWGGATVGDTAEVRMPPNLAAMTAYNNTLNEIKAQLESAPTSWDTSRWGALPAQDTDWSNLNAVKWGSTIEAPILVIDNDDFCTGTMTGGSYSVVGFIWGAIYDVSTEASGTGDGYGVAFRVDSTDRHWKGTEPDGPEYGVYTLGAAQFMVEDGG